MQNVLYINCINISNNLNKLEIEYLAVHFLLLNSLFSAINYLRYLQNSTYALTVIILLSVLYLQLMKTWGLDNIPLLASAHISCCSNMFNHSL